MPKQGFISNFKHFAEKYYFTHLIGWDWLCTTRLSKGFRILMQRVIIKHEIINYSKKFHYLACDATIYMTKSQIDNFFLSQNKKKSDFPQYSYNKNNFPLCIGVKKNFPNIVYIGSMLRVNL